MSGDSRFPLLPLKHFVEELKVPKDELEKVCGRNPFEVTEEELEEWSMDRKGIGKLFRFYADLNYGVNISEYLRKHSEHIKSEELRVETVTTNWLVGATTFPPKHLKGLANELEIPPDYVQRVTGVDLGEVKTTAEELDAAIAEFLDE